MNKPIFVIKDFHPSIKRDMQSKVTREVPATAEGYDLFTSIRDVHPIVVEGDGMLTGWLVYLDDENYEENLADVDLAHGCGHGSSVRETTAVRTFDGTTVDAYIYRTINFLDLQRVNGTSADVGIQVEHGNWMRWVTTKDFY